MLAACQPCNAGTTGLALPCTVSMLLLNTSGLVAIFAHLTELGWSVRSVDDNAVLLKRTVPLASAEPVSTPCVTASRSTRHSAAAEATPVWREGCSVDDAGAAVTGMLACHWRCNCHQPRSM